MRSSRVDYVYAPEMAGYRYAPGHPFNPLRLALTTELAVETGLLQRDGWRVPRPARDDELLLFHHPDYLAFLKECSKDGLPPCEPVKFGLGSEDNPVFAGMHEAAALSAGATLEAVRRVLDGVSDHAFSPGGGLHHAGPRQASGFCLYNDLVVAIQEARRRYGARVLYLDIDAHHGDGVQWAFYDDTDVLTISLHETGRYLFPYTGMVGERGRGGGYGYAVNVPLDPFTENDSFLEVFEEVVPPLLRAFAPDLVVSQHGCDAHYHDPLTHLSLTTHAYTAVHRRLHELVHERAGGRWVATGGGGYDIWRVVPRVWTALWAEMTDQAVPETLPVAWLERWRPYAPVELPGFFQDPPDLFPSMPRRAEIQAVNRRTAVDAVSASLRALGA